MIHAFLSFIFPILQTGDFMRSIGKMYVVVAVIVCIFLGLVWLLWSLDRRLKKLENSTNNERKK